MGFKTALENSIASVRAVIDRTVNNLQPQCPPSNSLSTDTHSTTKTNGESTLVRPTTGPSAKTVSQLRRRDLELRLIQSKSDLEAPPEKHRIEAKAVSWEKLT